MYAVAGAFAANVVVMVATVAVVIIAIVAVVLRGGGAIVFCSSCCSHGSKTGSGGSSSSSINCCFCCVFLVCVLLCFMVSFLSSTQLSLTYTSIPVAITGLLQDQNKIFQLYDVDDAEERAIKKLMNETWKHGIVGIGINAQNLTHTRIQVQTFFFSWKLLC